MRTIEQDASQLKITTPDSDEKKVIFIEFLTFNIFCIFVSGVFGL